MKRNILVHAAAMLLLFSAAAPVAAQDHGATAMVENPCPPASAVDPAMLAFVQMLVEPGAKFTPPPALPKPANPLQDWANHCRYRSENASITTPPDVVFMGDSITELWKYADPAFFGTRWVNRGISGQTSSQMLLRFQADVVALHPKVVHLLAGGNDLAGNAGLTSEQAYKDNIIAMVTLARANGIKVVLGSLTPVTHVWWAPEMQDASQIPKLNTWLREYARANGLGFAEYYPALVDAKGGIRKDYSNDEVHPNRTGYTALEPIARRALNQALGK